MIDSHASLSLLDAACLCAERGLHVIPVWQARDGVCLCPRGAECISPGKHPKIDSWQTAASTDLTVLRDWFAAGRGNIGVVCGASNVVVIDVDPRNGGDKTIAALVLELGPLPASVAADTGGGGKHYVFRRPASVDLVSKLKLADGTGDGVDLLHGSRQFLVEPSLHASGAVYVWQRGCAPDETEIAELPASWIARATRVATSPKSSTVPPIHDSERSRRAAAYLAKIPGAVSGDGGHTATFNAVAAVMIGFDLDTATTASLIAGEYNARCDPPWSEREIAHKIQSVADRCKRERGYLLTDRRPITAPPATVTAPAIAMTSSWTQRLLVKADRTVRRAYHNTVVFVRYHPDYAGQWSLDRMVDMPCFRGAPVAPTLVNEIRAAADCQLGYTPPVADVEAAILAAAAERPYHPVLAYLRSVDWDGVHRIRYVARDYLGSEDALDAEMIEKFMIGAAARMLWPGSKVDTALMLVGDQGIRKSTFFATLGGRWHADSFVDLGNKDGMIQVHSAWIYELAELETVMLGAAGTRLKAWITSSHDLFRAPYARVATRRERSFILCGTTNQRSFLVDSTGTRRNWVVAVNQAIDTDAIARVRDQLWAEAVAAAEAGQPWWLGEDSERARAERNEDYQETDSWTDLIRRYLSAPEAVLPHVTVHDVLLEAVKLETSRQGRWEQTRVARVLEALGWHKVRLREGETRSWAYRRGSTRS